AGGLQRAPDDGNAEPLKAPLDIETAIHQQDSLSLDAIDAGVAQDVHDREVRGAFSCWVLTVAPVRADRPVALPVCLDRVDVAGEVLTVQVPRGSRRELGVVDVPVLRERRVRDVRVFDHWR